MQRAEAIVLRTTDWSETSRIATLWTREHGKVRALAKGARRLRSSFENSLDLLNVCSIVLLRKSTGGLDLLTEARVARSFPRLRADLTALYAGYYVAELLADWTEDADPHPGLFDEAVGTLGDLGGGIPIGLRVLRFEMVFLRETGYQPILDCCAGCGGLLSRSRLGFSAAAGGLVCPQCPTGQAAGERRAITPEAGYLLRALAEPGAGWQGDWSAGSRAEARRMLGGFIGRLRGRQPRMLAYLGGQE